MIAHHTEGVQSMKSLRMVLSMSFAVALCGVFAPASADTLTAECDYAQYTGMGTTLTYRNYTLLGGMPTMTSFPWSASLYKFDISSLTLPVESAELEVEKIAGGMRLGTATNRLQVRAVDLLSDVATWPELDDSQYGDVLDTVVMGEDGIYRFDVTSLVNDWISGEKSNNGIALVVLSSDDFLDYDPAVNPAAYATLAGIDGSSYGSPNGASPVITATAAVPEPSTLGLLMVAGLAALLWRKP
jgi:hypothetical protein